MEKPSPAFAADAGIQAKQLADLTAVVAANGRAAQALIVIDVTLVLAVVIGIGSTLFSLFTAGFGGVTPMIDEAMAVIAALSLLGLGICGPGIANGIVSGAGAKLRSRRS